MTDQELKDARVIASMPVPAGMADWQWLDYQVQLVLLAAGQKQAMALVFVDPEAERVASETLRSIGLRVQSSPRPIHGYVHVFVARDQTSIDRLEHSLDASATDADEVHGQLSGFPETAIRAFVAGESIAPKDIPARNRATPAYVFGVFRYSSHWQQELETGRRWAETIQHVSTELYQRFLDTFHDMRQKIGD